MKYVVMGVSIFILLLIALIRSVSNVAIYMDNSFRWGGSDE